MSDRLRRQHRFTVTPEHLILDPRVGDRAFRLWCRLDRFAGNNETAYPTRETLAIELDCSPASIDRATTELVDAGWLLKERRAAGDTCLYTLVVAPEAETERLIKAARKQRVKDTEGRRESATKRRREAKKKASVKGSVESKNKQVNEGGVVTSDETPKQGGVVTSDETPVVTGDERGVITGDEQKEASTEGSIIEGDSASSLRSETAATDQPLDSMPDPVTHDDGRDAETPEPKLRSKTPVVLTEQELETGRDANGNALKGDHLTTLAQAVTKAWWDWITPAGHSKPTQSFISCRTVIRAALGNGIAPKDVKRALVVLTTEGRPVSGGSLGIAMQVATGQGPGGKGNGRRAYRDADEWADRPAQPQHDPWAEPA